MVLAGSMAAAERWYFTKEQLACTPSRKCGLDADKELSYRQQAANLIQDMGQRLQVYPCAAEVFRSTLTCLGLPPSLLGLDGLRCFFSSETPVLSSESTESELPGVLGRCSYGASDSAFSECRRWAF